MNDNGCCWNRVALDIRCNCGGVGDGFRGICSFVEKLGQIIEVLMLIVKLGFCVELLVSLGSIVL